MLLCRKYIQFKRFSLISQYRNDVRLEANIFG